jgi:hypothetical protein
MKRPKCGVIILMQQKWITIPYFRSPYEKSKNGNVEINDEASLEHQFREFNT